MGLLDDISKLTTPASELPDLEDDDGSSLLKLSGNKSKSAKNFNFEEGKYAGRAISRKEIFGDTSEISGLHGASDSEVDGEEDVEGEEEEDVEESDDDDVANGVKSDSDDDMEDEEDSEEDEEEESSSNLKMTTLSLKDDSDKADKATSVFHQKQVWDDLMYSNIRIHALLNTMNQMPRGDARKNMLKNADDSTKKSMENAMENMAKLRDLMKNAAGFFDEKKKKNGEDSDDEEIPSDDEEISSDFDEENDDDDKVSGSDDDDENYVKSTKNTGTSLKSLTKNLAALDTSIDKFRAATITKWYNRTKILNSKSMNSTDFSVFEKGSILGQINKVLADEEKLLKKVRTNRSGKSRIGAASADVIDNEIFDDSDFYQILLKQMIESRNQMNSQDGADMTRSYMELQSMFSNKKKRDVSQLSSKDRRLKYEPVAKLINFYPSKPAVATWSHESRNELFKSLFT